MPSFSFFFLFFSSHPLAFDYTPCSIISPTPPTKSIFQGIFQSMSIALFYSQAAHILVNPRIELVINIAHGSEDMRHGTRGNQVGVVCKLYIRPRASRCVSICAFLLVLIICLLHTIWPSAYVLSSLSIIF